LIFAYILIHFVSICICFSSKFVLINLHSVLINLHFFSFVSIFICCCPIYCYPIICAHDCHCLKHPKCHACFVPGGGLRMVRYIGLRKRTVIWCIVRWLHWNDDAHRCTLSHGMSWLLFKACSSAQHSRIELNLRFSVRDPWPMDSKGFLGPQPVSCV